MAQRQHEIAKSVRVDTYTNATCPDSLSEKANYLLVPAATSH